MSVNDALFKSFLVINKPLVTYRVGSSGVVTGVINPDPTRTGLQHPSIVFTCIKSGLLNYTDNYLFVQLFIIGVPIQLTYYRRPHTINLTVGHTCFASMVQNNRNAIVITAFLSHPPRIEHGL